MNRVVKKPEMWRSQTDGFPQDAVPVAEEQEGNAIQLLTLAKISTALSGATTLPRPRMMESCPQVFLID